MEATDMMQALEAQRISKMGIAKYGPSLIITTRHASAALRWQEQIRRYCTKTRVYEVSGGIHKVEGIMSYRYHR